MTDKIHFEGGLLGWKEVVVDPQLVEGKREIRIRCGKRTYLYHREGNVLRYVAGSDIDDPDGVVPCDLDADKKRKKEQAKGSIMK